STLCSTKRKSRRSVKQCANRGIKPRPWSTCLNSRAPAFDVIVPPSNCATTARRPTASKSKRLGVHCVCIGGFRRITKCRCGTTDFADSRPRCAQMFEKSGLGHSERIDGPPTLPVVATLGATLVPYIILEVAFHDAPILSDWL